MARLSTVATRTAGLTLLAVVIGAVTLAPSAHRQVVAARLPARPTAPTTVPPPATTTTVAPAPATTAPAVAVPAAVRVCPPAVLPDAATTELATPNTANITYSASPGGPPVGLVTSRWGGPSTRPVIDQQNGWVEVRLASRPNGSTGWVASQSVSLAATAYRIVISICQRSMTVFQGPTPVYSAPVGIGRPQWPTPLGPSFIDAAIATPRRLLSVYGPTVFALGTHSDVFTEFGGGDGTVAIHGYPSDPASTRGVASSHGCVRVAAATVNVLSGVPVGTPVDVIS